MSCRIEICDRGGERTVRLAGRLAEAHIPDFLQACAHAGRPVTVELSELTSADALGVEALLRVESDGARLVAIPEYLRLKLDVLAHERWQQVTHNRES